MNDLLPFCKFKRAVMKIDIEGFEHRAFGEVDDLFDNIDIPFVQMEWAHVKMKGNRNQVDSEEVDLFHHMMSFLVQRHYRPQCSLHGQILNLTEFKKWPRDIIWAKQNASSPTTHARNR